jgi:hypothetical protein
VVELLKIELLQSAIQTQHKSWNDLFCSSKNQTLVYFVKMENSKEEKLGKFGH